MYLNASLIGKALVFGPNEYRFDSYAFKLVIAKPHVYLQNHLHFSLQQVFKFNKIMYSQHVLVLVKVLDRIGFIHKFLIINKEFKYQQIKQILITMFFYKNTPFFKSCCIVSTSSKNVFISIKALRLLKLILGSSIVVLSTSSGVITHRKALHFGIGGRILYVLR